MSSSHYEEPESSGVSGPLDSDGLSEHPTESKEDQKLVLVEHLREARESKGWSIEDLSDKTRISLHVVVSIEAGDLDVVEVPFMRAFLRTYAKAVGVPFEEVEDLYPEPKALVEEPEEGEDIHAIPIPSRSRLPWGIIGKVTLVVGVLAFIWWLQPWFSIGGDDSRQAYTPIAEAPAQEPPVEESAPVDTVASDSTAEESVVMPGPDEEPMLRERKATPPPPPPTFARRQETPTPRILKTAKLAATTSDTVWVQLMDAATDEILYDAVLSPGSTRAWTVSDTVQVSLGRHWAVVMTLDGDTIQVPGRPGRNVSVFYFGPSGVIRP